MKGNTLSVVFYCLFLIHCSSESKLIEDEFGSLDMTDNDGNPYTETVRRFTLSNENGVSVQVINYGGIITSIKVPDNTGSIDDVVLGFDDVSGYRQENNPYFGAIIGRVANRIRDGKFSIDGVEYQVTLNYDGFQMHGGFKGFDKVLWEPYIDGDKLTLAYLSEDGEEGFPGAVLAQVSYQLTPDNDLVLEMKATSTKATPVNLCNHSYFNLGGHGCGSKCILEHSVSINATQYTVLDDLNIPTGEIKDVAGTYLDLRTSTLMDVLPSVPRGGYDNNMCVSQSEVSELSFISRVEHAPSGRTMEVFSNQPGVQFYTSNSLPELNAPAEEQVIGKGGAVYPKWGALCLETQNYPDAVNHINFPDSILTPGKEYVHKVIYRFGTVSS